MNAKRAIVLLSGGLDSTTCLEIARQAGFEIHAISFRYGQRHTFELELATTAASSYGVATHRIVDINLAQFGGSALTDASIAVPKSEHVSDLGTAIPVTYVPARNTVFLSLSLALAEVLDSRDIFIGVNALDYSGYPDCRPDFIAAFEAMANLATKASVESDMRPLKIHTPLIDLTKAQIIALGISLSVDYSKTLSCYDPASGVPCGHCDACLLRAKGFAENSMNDPALG